MASPSAADLPRPRAAVRDTVVLSVFSDMASTNFNRALAWSNVLKWNYCGYQTLNFLITTIEVTVSTL